MRKELTIILIIAILIATNSTVIADIPYKSYIYTMDGGRTNIAASPLPYLPAYTINSKKLGIAIENPRDMHKDNSNNIYIVDMAQNMIIIIDEQWELVNTVKKFDNNGVEDTFNRPEGIYVSSEGLIYVADTGNKRVVIIDTDGNLVTEILKPDSPILRNDFNFEPTKIAVGESGSIYVLIKGVYEGVMEITRDGIFLGYLGSNPVKFDPLDIIWRNIMTDEQRERMVQFIPIEYSNISIDSSGFIYAVTSSENITTPVRRLNPSGIDVLVRNPVIPVSPIHGDIRTQQLSTIHGPSTFVDIKPDYNGIYSILDSKRGRVFTYDNESNLLYVFGGIGTNQIGTFINPVAIEMVGDKFLVLDSTLASITVFEPTEYAMLIREGINLYNKGLYEESLETWEDVVKLNANFDYAYVQMGRIYLREGRYEEAIRSFKFSNDREAYSRAFKRYRRDFLVNNLGYILTFLLIVVTVLFVISFSKKKYKSRINISQKREV